MGYVTGRERRLLPRTVWVRHKALFTVNADGIEEQEGLSNFTLCFDHHGSVTLCGKRVSSFASERIKGGHDDI